VGRLNAVRVHRFAVEKSSQSEWLICDRDHLSCSLAIGLCISFSVNVSKPYRQSLIVLFVSVGITRYQGSRRQNHDPPQSAQLRAIALRYVFSVAKSGNLQPENAHYISKKDHLNGLWQSLTAVRKLFVYLFAKLTVSEPVNSFKVQQPTPSSHSWIYKGKHYRMGGLVDLKTRFATPYVSIKYDYNFQTFFGLLEKL
jgi:hypothetical protein